MSPKLFPGGLVPRRFRKEAKEKLLGSNLWDGVAVGSLSTIIEKPWKTPHVPYDKNYVIHKQPRAFSGTHSHVEHDMHGMKKDEVILDLEYFK